MARGEFRGLVGTMAWPREDPGSRATRRDDREESGAWSTGSRCITGFVVRRGPLSSGAPDVTSGCNGLSVATPSGSALVRVLQVLPYIGPGGGSEQSLAMVDPLLVDRGIDVHLAYLAGARVLVDGLRAARVQVHDLSAGSSSTWSRARRVRRLVDEIRPDVVHSTLLDADLACRLAALGKRVVPLSTWANTSYDPVRRRLESGYGGWRRDVVRVLDAASARVSGSRFHAVTPGVADDGVRGLRVDRSRVHVVERGRDLSRFRPPTPDRRAAARSSMGVEGDDVVLLNVARQYHQKGHVHLIRAVDRLVDRRPDLRLVLVGQDGPATSAIDAELASMRHPDRVTLLGQRTDVEDLLPGADAFVLSSVAEGAAGAVLESMAAQVPVVATRIQGLRGWVVDGEHALLAEPGDPTGLADAIDRVLADPAAANVRAVAARELVERRFSLERSADGMASMYRELAADARSRSGGGRAG